MLVFNDILGKQHQINTDLIQSVKAEFDEITELGVLLEMKTGTIKLVKSNNFSSTSKFDDVIIVDSPVYVLRRTLDLKILRK